MFVSIFPRLDNRGSHGSGNSNEFSCFFEKKKFEYLANFLGKMHEYSKNIHFNFRYCENP